MTAAAAYWPEFITTRDATLAGAVGGLAQSQHLPLAALRAGQQAQLTNLLRSAVKQVPWYGRADWAAATLAAIEREPAMFWQHWARIPLLTKPELRAHGAALRARSVPAAHAPLGTVSTSGSTGIPVEVQTTTVTRLAWHAQTAREHGWRERDLSGRLGAIRAMKRDQRAPAGLQLPNWGSPMARLGPTGPSGAIHIGLDLELVRAWLTRFDPHYLLTYPSLIAALLDIPGSRPPALREVRLMSEPLDPELEARLRAEWGVGVADVYSANEVGNIAMRCAADSLHTLPESILVEILDERGEPCAVGETGRVVLTPLHNVAQPLIRFEIGDYATVGPPCRCGRTHPVLARVMGRVRNIAVKPDGKRFWPTTLLLVRKIEAIRQFQYVQTAPDAIELRVVLDRPLSTAEQQTAIATVQRVLAYPYRVDIRPVAAIERGPTGKFEEFLSLIA